MKQEHKLYAAIGAMLVLGIAVYMVMGEREKAAEARSVQAAQDLPVVKLTKEEAGKVTKFVIKNKDKGTVTIEKKGDEWRLTAPTDAKANEANVRSIVDNLEKIELTAVIGEDAAIHEKYELTDGKAIHVQAFKGDEKVLDMLFGKSGSRGQMARMGGEGAKPTVYATKGYSAYVWGREVKNWRHNEIMKFDEANPVAIEVENENGKFSFKKEEDAWSGVVYERDEDGKLKKKPRDIEDFDKEKLVKLMQAYKGLKATNFADEGADTGVDAPIESGGGTIRITMKDEQKPKFVIHVGKAQEGSNRYLKLEGDDQVYVVTSFSTDWASAKEEKFQKKEDPKDKVDEDFEGGDDKDDKDAKKDAKDAKKDAKKDAPKPAPAKKEAPKPAPAPKPTDK